MHTIIRVRYVWMLIVDSPGECQQTPHYLLLLNQKALPSGDEFSVVVHSVWIFYGPNRLLLLNVAGIGGLCRWSIHLTSAISKAHGKEILQLSHFPVSYTHLDVYKRQA